MFEKMQSLQRESEEVSRQNQELRAQIKNQNLSQASLKQQLLTLQDENAKLLTYQTQSERPQTSRLDDMHSVNMELARRNEELLRQTQSQEFEK
jgi:hypothetical protein